MSDILLQLNGKTIEGSGLELGRLFLRFTDDTTLNVEVINDEDWFHATDLRLTLTGRTKECPNCSESMDLNTYGLRWECDSCGCSLPDKVSK